MFSYEKYFTKMFSEFFCLMFEYSAGINTSDNTYLFFKVQMEKFLTSSER